jgi:DNA-binding NtrC family response regulator
MVTGHANMETAIDALRAGAFDFVPKPSEPDALVHAVERALRHHRLASELTRLRRTDPKLDPAALPEGVGDLVSAAELERRYVSHVLTMVKGNKSRAARILGFDRRTLYRKLERSASEREAREATSGSETEA